MTAYNRAVGSLESRVLVSARKLNELGVTDAELEAPKPVEETVRALSAPDLVAGRPGTRAGPGPARTAAARLRPSCWAGPGPMGAAG